MRWPDTDGQVEAEQAVSRVGGTRGACHGWSRSVDVGLGRLGRSSLSHELPVTVMQDFSNRPHSGSFEGIRCCRAASKSSPRQNDGGLGDESDDTHFGAASTGQGVDLVDAVDELGPPPGQNASRRGGVAGLSWWRCISSSARGAYAGGVDAVEMDEVLVYRYAPVGPCDTSIDRALMVPQRAFVAQFKAVSL